MIITPLKDQKSRPVALVVPSWRSVTIYTTQGERYAHGPQQCYELLSSLGGHVNYVPAGLRSLINTTGATAWTADVWRGRAVSMSLDGTTFKATSLRRTLSNIKNYAEMFDALIEVTQFLSDQGVRAGSLSSMAWHLWRSTLSSPIELGFDPKVSSKAFYGGRKRGPSRPHVYRDQVALDISKAYPHAMISRPYAGLMREVDKTTTIDPEVSGLAKVRVHVPENSRFALLPVRLAPNMIQWRLGYLEGVYTWGEIAAAASLGAEVEVLRTWAPLTEISPFGPWWELMTSAYATLTPNAVKLVKALGNLVWSHFAMNGDDAATIRWQDDLGDRPMMTEKGSRSMPQANTIHLAAETSSRVRVRMLLEGLYGDVEDPVHVDTDGMIVSAASAARRRTGDLVGDWRPKTFMDLVEIRAPQLYRYTCGPSCGIDHSRYHYVAAGTPAKYAAELFDGKHPGFQISMSGEDTVIPDGHDLNLEQRSRYLLADEELQRIIYGPPLVGL